MDKFVTERIQKKTHDELDACMKYSIVRIRNGYLLKSRSGAWYFECISDALRNAAELMATMEKEMESFYKNSDSKE